MWVLFINSANCIVSLEGVLRPWDSYESILQLVELEVPPMDFARKLAPMAGLRNILAHEYMAIDWDLVYEYLQCLDDLYRFMEYLQEWLRARLERRNPV